jgi:hypothetical protein
MSWVTQQMQLVAPPGGPSPFTFPDWVSCQTKCQSIHITVLWSYNV